MKIREAELAETETIKKEMLEKRPLPLGRQEFDEWFDRIWSGALIPCQEGQEEKLKRSGKFAAASMIMHLGPTESVKEDAYFIHALRKACVNEVANALIVEFKNAQKAAQEQQVTTQ